MITVAGAFRILAPLAPLDRAASLALPSAEVTHTKRAGLMFTDVGPNLARS